MDENHRENKDDARRGGRVDWISERWSDRDGADIVNRKSSHPRYNRSKWGGRPGSSAGEFNQDSSNNSNGRHRDPWRERQQDRKRSRSPPSWKPISHRSSYRDAERQSDVIDTSTMQKRKRSTSPSRTPPRRETSYANRGQGRERQRERKRSTSPSRSPPKNRSSYNDSKHRSEYIETDEQDRLNKTYSPPKTPPRNRSSSTHRDREREREREREKKRSMSPSRTPERDRPKYDYGKRRMDVDEFTEKQERKRSLSPPRTPPRHISSSRSKDRSPVKYRSGYGYDHSKRRSSGSHTNESQKWKRSRSPYGSTYYNDRRRSTVVNTSKQQDPDTSRDEEHANRASVSKHKPIPSDRRYSNGRHYRDLDKITNGKIVDRRQEGEEKLSSDGQKNDIRDVPSDAMQAAMEAALGLPSGSIKSQSSSIPDTLLIEQDKEDDEQPPPPILRARPDEIYEQIAQVGEGTYGQVFKAKSDKTGVVVALKKIRMESEKDGFPITAMREIKLLQGLRHENVVRLHEMLLSKNSVYMVFEYLEHDLNGILSQATIQFEPAHLKSLAKQLLAGLAYLHRHSILHRDLKGSNLLLHRDGTLKLADFGLARRYTKRAKTNVDYTNRVVTLWYRPPELLFGETCYNDAIDVWGAGCIFIELFTRRPIFQGNDEIHQVQVLFDMLGPIEKKDWPTVDTLPWYDLVQCDSKSESDKLQEDPQKISSSKSRVHQLFGDQMPSDALDVAAALLCYNPTRRISAAAALQSDYFAINLPKPEKPSEILKSVMGEWHEFESRQAKRGILATVDSSQQTGSGDSFLRPNTIQMGPPTTSIAGPGHRPAERQVSA